MVLFDNIKTVVRLRIKSENQLLFLNIIFTFLIFSLSGSASVFAQIDQLKEGDLVRISAPIVQPDRIKGTVSILSPSVLVLSIRDSLVYISHSTIQSLEVSDGRKRTTGRGLLIGAVAGTFTFGILSAVTNNPCGRGDGWCFLETRNGDAFLSGATTGLVIGAAAGAIIGHFIRIERWERVPVRIVMDVAPSDQYQFAAGAEISLKIPISKR